MNNRVKLRVVGLDENCELVIRSMVRLVSNQLKKEWVFSEAEEPDIIIGNPDDSEYKSLQIAALQNVHNTRFIQVSIDGRVNDKKALCLSYPINVSELFELLKNLEVDVVRQVATAQQTTPKPLAVEASARYVLELTSAIQREASFDVQHELLLRSAGSPQILIRLPDGKFSRCDGTQLSADDGEGLLNALNWMKSKVEVVKQEGSSEDLADKGENWIPLECFYWHLGVNVLSQQLMPGLDQGMRFKLKRWPDFGRNGGKPSHLKMAALMVRKALKLAELEKITRLPLESITSFINACALCGLLQPVNSAGDLVDLDITRIQSQQKQAHGLANVFTAIRSVFGMRAS